MLQLFEMMLFFSRVPVLHLLSNHWHCKPGLGKSLGFEVLYTKKNPARLYKHNSNGFVFPGNHQNQLFGQGAFFQ